MHPTRTLFVLFALSALAACGTKTPLTLPSPQAKPPAKPAVAPVAAPAAASAAVSPAPTLLPGDDSNKAGRTGQ